MKQYLISIFQPQGPPPAPEVMAKIDADVGAVHADLMASGAWVFASALFPPETATVLRPTGDVVLTVDGPFAEAKEFLGGFCVVRATDLDAALAWGARFAIATTLPTEVRPFMDETTD